MRATHKFHHNYFETFPRTVQEAFGPHTSREVYEDIKPFVWTPLRTAYLVVYVSAIITVFAVSVRGF